MTTHCKIGKIKFKSGGSLHLLSKPEPLYKNSIMTAIKDWTDTVTCDIIEPVGFVAIAWGKDGTHTIQDFFSDQSHVCRSMGPTYVAECLRRRNAVVDNSQ